MHALLGGRKGTGAVGGSAIFARGGGVARRPMPVAAAETADGMADVAIPLATGQSFVNELVNDADEAVDMPTHRPPPFMQLSC
jgi:hypothetical protein